jgi:hypothetical protein
VVHVVDALQVCACARLIYQLRFIFSSRVS